MSKARDLADFISDSTIETAEIADGAVTAGKLNVTGNGTSGQALTSDADGSFSWTTITSDLVDDASPQLGANLDTNGNDITFGDNDKAIFGAGSDLQIYHDGSGSFISDQGTGNIKILAGNFKVHDTTDTEIIAQFNQNADVSLYYDNSQKLATTSTGIDVTGTVTADGLTVDGGGMLLDSSGDSVFTMTVGGTSNNARIDFNNGTSVDGGITYDHDGAFASEKLVLRAGNNTSHVYLTGDGNVGIGTSSPRSDLEIQNSAGGELTLRYTGNSGFAAIKTNASSEILFSTNQTSFQEKMRLDNSGNLGIGTSSPANKLHVQTGSATQDRFRVGEGFIEIGNSIAGGDVVGKVEFYRHDSATGQQSTQAYIESRSGGTWYSNSKPQDLRFYTTDGSSITAVETVRIDGGANLRFNSGYGSVATAYGVRVWVNFQGNAVSGGNNPIRGSGNVSTVGDNGVGNHYVNFSTAMPDTNYSVVTGVTRDYDAPSNNAESCSGDLETGRFNINTYYADSASNNDWEGVHAIVVR